MQTTTWSKLTDEDRLEILAAVRAGESIDAIAIRYNLKASSLARKLRKLKAKKAPPADSKEQVLRDERHNTATLESKSLRITTLEQLLEACNVDLSVWKVDRYVVNKWEVGTKIASGGVLVEPLFQVKAWLVRIRPEPILPVIQPVTASITPCDFPKPSRAGLHRALIWADPHFGFVRDLQTGHLTPFHDRRALDIIVQIAQATRPDRIDCLGDLLDLPEWTDRFLRSPEFYYTTQPAVLEAHWWLTQLRLASPESAINIYEGNHDRRMRDAVVTHLRAAYDLRAADEINMPPALSVPKLLGLRGLGIHWIDNYPHSADWLNDGVRLSHGEKAQVQGNTAKAVVNEADSTEIFGHIHRIEWVSRTKHERNRARLIAGFCPGCTCHIDGRVPAKAAQSQWQEGCAIVDYEVEGNLYAIHPLVIDGGRAVWNGNLFTARDRLDEIRLAWEGWNW